MFAKVTCRALAAAFALTLPLPAQWAATASPAPGPVHSNAFHVLAGMGTDVIAFSAMSRRWRSLAPAAGATVLGTGDWTALLRIDDRTHYTYRAYSARMDQRADLAIDSGPGEAIIRIEDDVILVAGRRGAEWLIAGYSAETNAWETLASQAPPAQIATSRFVLGVQVFEGGVYGFGARHGHWVLQACLAPLLEANGNVLLAKEEPPVAAKAFSGVLGSWSTSPAQHASSEELLDHNVAYVRGDGTLAFDFAYSAYTGVWTGGGPSPSTTPRLTDNTLYLATPVASPGTPRTIKAFGARPGRWARLSAGRTSTLHAGADWVVVDDASAATLHAFSGLLGAAWSPRTYAGTVSVIAGPEHIAAALEPTGAVHAFSPLHAAWAPVSALPAPVPIFGACYVANANASQRASYSSRSNAWLDGPARDPAATYTYGAAQGVFVDRNTTTGELTFLHERRNGWVTVSMLGMGTPTFAGLGNVMIVDATGMTPSGGVLGFSAQRGDVIGASGMVLPLTEGPVVEENVAWVRDANGIVHAFGSPADTHSWYALPNDTEYQATDPVTVPARVTMRGTPGDIAILLLSVYPYFPGYGVPGVGGLLHLDPLLLLTPFPVGVIAPHGLLVPPLTLAGAPAGFELWTQGVLLSGSGSVRFLGPVPEPVWFF